MEISDALSEHNAIPSGELQMLIENELWRDLALKSASFLNGLIRGVNALKCAPMLVVEVLNWLLHLPRWSEKS